jgi:hypothetical protein
MYIMQLNEDSNNILLFFHLQSSSDLTGISKLYPSPPPPCCVNCSVKILSLNLRGM